MPDIFEVNDKVQKALEKYFQQHRLVFWYDDKADMKSLFESMQFTDIEKLVIANNEFGIKYTVLIEKPKQKFLIYQPKPKPEPKDNWLLDIYCFARIRTNTGLQDLHSATPFILFIR
jgi:hypothetical protein